MMDSSHGQPKPWLAGPLALSRESCRFELPMDTNVLSTMSVIDYVAKYCVVCSRRKLLYKQTFIKHDRDKDNALTAKELKDALSDLYVQPDAKECIEEMIQLLERDKKPIIEITEVCTQQQVKLEVKKTGKKASNLSGKDKNVSSHVTLEQFTGVAAFVERMVYSRIYGTSETEGVQRTANERHKLEVIDFDGLKWKLRDCNINPGLKRMFEFLC